MNEASNPLEGIIEWTAVWGSFQASRAEPPLACSVRCVVCLMIAFGGVPPSSHLSVVLQHRGSERAREGGKKDFQQALLHLSRAGYHFQWWQGGQ